METEKQRMNLLLFYAIILLLGYLGYQIAQPFLVPLVWAGILALCAQPLHRRLAVKLNPSLAAIFSTVAVALLLIVPAVLLAIALAGEIKTAVTSLQEVIGSLHENERVLEAWAWVEAHVPMAAPDEIKGKLMQAGTTLTRFMAGQAGAAIQASSIFFFKLFVTLFALFFFLCDGPALGNTIQSILPFGPKRNEELMTRTAELVFAGSMATLTVAAVQGLTGGIVFAALGLPAPIFWGVVMGFCALLPLFGTALIWGPAVVGLLAMGHWGKAVILLVLGLLLVGGIDNLLRPILVSSKTQMNGLVVFISILGGVTAFGFVGLVVGPVVAAAIISLLELGTVGVAPVADKS